MKVESRELGGITYDSVRVQATSGQWYVRQRTRNAAGDVLSVYQRPIYPGEVVTALAPEPEPEEPEEDAVDLSAVPPPSVPSHELPLDAPWLPRAVKTAVKQARNGGWTARLFHSRGPRVGARGKVLEHDVDCIGLRCDRGRDRVVMTWLRKGEDWSFDIALATGRGRVSSPEAGKILKA